MRANVSYACFLLEYAVPITDADRTTICINLEELHSQNAPVRKFDVRTAKQESLLSAMRSTFEPFVSSAIKSLDFRAMKAWPVRFHWMANPMLKIGRMPVAFRETSKDCRIQRDVRRWIDRIHAILLVDRVA